MKICHTALVAILFLSSCQPPNDSSSKASEVPLFSDYQVTGLQTSLDPATNQITLSWTALPGASSYEIQQLIADPFSWQTLFSNLSSTTKTLATATIDDQEINPKPYNFLWSGRVKAASGGYASKYSDPVMQQLYLDYTFVVFDGSNNFKVNVIGPNQYQGELHFRNDGNVTVHNLTIWYALLDSSGQQSSSGTVSYPGSVAPGGIAVILSPVLTITSFVPDRVVPNYFGYPRVNIN